MQNKTFMKALFIFIWIIKCLESLYLFSHGDALNYHIVWPKILHEVGLNTLFTEFFPVWLAGYFDLLYIIPFSLFGASPWAQMMSQFLHFFFSLGLGSFILVSFFRKTDLAYLMGIILLTLNKSSDFFLYAKNDGFIALLVLVSYIMLTHIESDRKVLKNTLLISLLAGIAVGSKLSAAFSFLPIGLYLTFLFIKRSQYRYITYSFFTSLALALPPLYLKWIYLKSPFFPGLLSVFPGDFSPENLQAWKNFVSKKASLSSILTNLKYYFFNKAVFIALPLSFIFRKKAIWLPLLLSLSSFLLYLLFNGGVTSARFYFASVFLLVLALGELFLHFFEKIPSKRNIIFVVLLILTLVDSKLDKSLGRITIFGQDVFSIKERELVRKYIPRTQVWDYVPKGTQNRKIHILAEGFAQSYYAPSYVRLHEQAYPEVKKIDPAHCRAYPYLIKSIHHEMNCDFSKDFKEIYRWESFILYQRI